MPMPSSVQTWLVQGKRQLLSLVLSSPCPLCQRSASAVLCPSCCRRLRQCQTSTPYDPGTDLAVITWGCYEGSLRQAIGSLKYSGHTDLAQFLGIELGQTWHRHAPRRDPAASPVAIVPIPLHASKLQQRGFNQADLLAQWFCRQTRLPLCSQGLVRSQATQAQHSLGRSARQRNLAQAFAVNPAQVRTLRKATVWLLDDIFTTGATAQAAAQTLRQSGVTVGGICAVARAIAWNADS
ncbi:ComF family protein [Nodosilinea nodulosa]|uniref:ComF family protein n=1 Tax=Nodosilinea nodulosa TaxID=416001 RepID=UPI000300C521|nr:ComF family protein [Nodosilinea nodulosa]